ncbi:MAG: phospho-N-acetylmuramoyl-pentapeptide-transferase [Anaerococcus sp.]|nr:phospho-N-acetylmuramoyl-pentapeptide-transferase [Anaerococcus sp.]
MNKFYVIIISIFLSMALGKIIIPILKSRKIGQNIRQVGPKSHYQKAGTPTMGGIIFILSALVMTLILLPLNLETAIILISFIGFGAIGFIDDFRKLILKQSEGLSPRGKLILQFGLALIITILAYINDRDSVSQILLPFINKSINISILGFPLLVFIIVGATNATNLTDGLDGLLTSVSLPVFISLAILAKNTDLEIFSLILFGSLLGFLIFNSYPASVFMGDTGSMAIGGAIVALAIIMHLQIYLVIFGGIYVAETLSVIIQVLSYRHRNKKRVFLMTPIHHHFELKGHKESKIVVGFTLVSVILCMITLAALI